MIKNFPERLKIFIESKKTVFTTKNLADLWRENSRNTAIFRKE